MTADQKQKEVLNVSLVEEEQNNKSLRATSGAQPKKTVAAHKQDKQKRGYCSPHSHSPCCSPLYPPLPETSSDEFEEERNQTRKSIYPERNDPFQEMLKTIAELSTQQERLEKQTENMMRSEVIPTSSSTSMPISPTAAPTPGWLLSPSQAPKEEEDPIQQCWSGVIHYSISDGE